MFEGKGRNHSNAGAAVVSQVSTVRYLASRMHGQKRFTVIILIKMIITMSSETVSSS